MNWFYFTWNGNVQEIWNLPGPEPSFSAKYHFDYWLKTILSMVVLFRNFTTHLHLLFYIAMLYPILTGERPGLMLPWLYLQMLKNIVTDVICATAGVLLCWIVHPCGLMALEFLIVQIISTMPSIYLWRSLRSYYFRLYYAELDGEPHFPIIKTNRDLTLAQRRRATKSLDRTMSMIISADNRSRVNSCLTYNEFFGPANWKADGDNKISKSLTTLLTIESHESDDAEEDNCLIIIDDENLTPAEKTLKSLGLTREEVDATSLLQLQKRTSTTDLCESVREVQEPSTDLDLKSSFLSITGETVERRTVATQVRLPDDFRSTALNGVSGLSEEEGVERSKNCECCQETKCSKEEDTDSDEEEDRPISQSTKTTGNHDESFRRVEPLHCCNQNRAENGKRHENPRDNEETDEDNVHLQFDTNFKRVSTLSRYYTNYLCPSSRLQAVVERDGIAWENLKEINFVSVINKALSSEVKPFKLQRDCVDSNEPGKYASSTFKNVDERWGMSAGFSGEKTKCQSEQNSKEIIPEREDGTKFIHRRDESSDINIPAFSGPTSASFGIESDILALNASRVFEKTSISGTQSFDSTASTATQLIRPDYHICFESHFKSSFQRHSNMFDDTRARLEPLVPLHCKVHSSNYRESHGVNEDSCSYRPTSNTLQYGRGYYDSLDFSRGNFTGNEIDANGDIHKSSETGNGEALADSQTHCDSRTALKNCQIITAEKTRRSAIEMAEKGVFSSPTNLVKENYKPTRDSQSSSVISRPVFEAQTLTTQKSSYIIVTDKSTSNLEAMVLIGEWKNSNTKSSVTGEKFSLKDCRRKGSKERRSLASSSRSSRLSKTRETFEEREAKVIQALKAYNEKTLFEYKREMDACSRLGRYQGSPSIARHQENEFKRDSTSNENSSSVNRALYVPSAPGLEMSEKELILRMENAYARYTRSKPTGPASSETLHRNYGTKKFCEIYSGGKSQKIKDNDKSSMRKQHSRYSKLGGGINESDVTSRSCKRIEGSQKGRELDRTMGKENVRLQNLEVYFLERQVDENPSTSKNAIIATIKPFVRKNSTDAFSTVSSDILTPGGSRSPMIEILNNPEEIPSRIEDSEYYRQLRKTNVPKDVKEAVNNIDWSFQSSSCMGNDRRKQNHGKKTSSGMTARISGADMSLERQGIVEKTTENILQSAFANGENSERGFHLGELGNEFYPIFNTVAIAMEEIVRAAALRGYTDEFISQPATEIEIPEVESEDIYGVTAWPSELRRRSSCREFLRLSIFSEDIRTVKNGPGNKESLSVATSTVLDRHEKKPGVIRRDQDPLDQDNSTFVDDEEASSLLKKLIASAEPRSAEINIPVIGTQDIPEESEDVSGDLPIPKIKDMEDYSSFIFKDSTTSKKSRNSLRCKPENFLQVGVKSKRISSEQLRLALQNVVYQSPGPSLNISKFPGADDSQFGFDGVSYRRILDQFNAGGKELQRIVLKCIDRFPNCETSVTNGDPNQVFPENLRGSDFMAGMEMLANLHEIETKAGEVMDATEYREGSEETPSNSLENSSVEQNDQSEDRSGSERATTQAGSSGTMNANTPTGSRGIWRKQDREKKENNLDDRVVGEIKSNPDSRTSSSGKIDKPPGDDKKLLSSISDADAVSPTQSELLNRANFRRNVIDSAFIKAIRQDNSSKDLTKKAEAEIAASSIENEKFENKLLHASDQELKESKSRNLIDVDSEAEMLELWMTDDEQVPSESKLVSSREDLFLIDGDNARPDALLRDIGTAECAIERMKTLLENFFAEDQGEHEEVKKYEKSAEMKSKVSSLTNLRFQVNWELRKLHNWVQTVANYVTITVCSSAQTIKSSGETDESDKRRRDLNAGGRSESSDNFEEVPETLPKNELQSNTPDFQASQLPVPKPRSTLNNSQRLADARDEVDQFSSWDKMIPLSKKRQVVKNNRKNKFKKSFAVREPQRRVVKVVKLTGEQSSDFFSARSVPQRGRGLSSGYLMDSDSDGNFTVSRPLTPISVESEISQTLSCDNQQPAVFVNPLRALEFFPMSETSQSRTTRPMETCWSSSSTSPIKELANNSVAAQGEMKFAEKENDDVVESMEMKQSLEISFSSLLNDEKVSPTRKSASPDITADDQTTRNAWRDEESLELSVEGLLTGSGLRFMTSVDAAGIENKLKDVAQQILSHKFSGVERLTNVFQTSRNDASFTSVSGRTMTDSSIDSRSNSCNQEKEVEEEEGVKQECRNRIKEILPKPDDTTIEELNAHCRSLNSTSGNSDAVSFDVSPRKSGVILKNVAVRTEEDIKVFKELLDKMQIDTILHSSDLQGSNCTLGETKSADNMPRNFFNSVNSYKNLGATMPVISSYDSFGSLFYQNATDRSESSCRPMSISNHTYLEEFPKQVDSSFQLSLSSNSSEKDAEGKESLERDTNSANSVKSSNNLATDAPGSSKSNDGKLKKDSSPKKTGIPRPVKSSKERK